MLRHVEVENPPAVMREHDEHEEDLEADRRDRKEIQRDDFGQVISQERPPRR
jgi:hypothetical protein